MKKDCTLQGLITAVTTPFSSQQQLDDGALTAHLQWLNENGANQFLVGGTTGEFFSLTLNERLQLLSVAARLPHRHLMFHAGANGFNDTLRLVQAAESEGADSVAVILPYFLASAPHEGLVSYLAQLSSSTSLPFVIYNFPKHTQVRATPELLKEVPHFALKDSSADLSLVTHTPNYFIGSDRLLLTAYDKGAAGFISARSNAYPALYAQMDAVARKLEAGDAASLHQQILTVCDQLSGAHQIKRVKEAVQQFLPGYPTGVRLPLT